MEPASLSKFVTRTTTSGSWTSHGRRWRFTFGPAVDQFPVWARDGKRVIYASARGGPRNLFSQAADGFGSVERLTHFAIFQTPAALSADGSRLVVIESDSKTGTDMKTIDLTGTRPTETLIAYTIFQSRIPTCRPTANGLPTNRPQGGSTIFTSVRFRTLTAASG